MAPITTTNFEGKPSPDVLGAVIRNEYHDEIPIMAMILAAGRTRPAINQKPEWYTTSPSGRRTQINNGGSAYNAATTALVVDDASLFRAGELVFCEATGEIIYVSAVNTGSNTLTVTRGVGTTAAIASVADDAFLMSIGNAHGEGAGAPDSSAAGKVMAYNTLQTFRRSVEITGRQLRSKTLTESERPFQRVEQFKEITRDMYRAMLFGARSENVTDAAGRKVTTMGGLRSMVTTNITNVGGTLSKDELKAICKTNFATGSSEKVLAGGADLIGAITDLYDGTTRITNTTVADTGLKIQSVQTAFGRLKLVLDRTFTGALAGDGLILDMDELWWRESVPAEGKPGDQGGKLHLRADTHDKDEDAIRDEYFAEGTVEFGAEQKHGQIRGVTGADLG